MEDVIPKAKPSRAVFVALSAAQRRKNKAAEKKAAKKRKAAAAKAQKAKDKKAKAAAKAGKNVAAPIGGVRRSERLRKKKD